MTDIEIQNVGPIENISILLPEDGGVVVFRGRNGSGKSLALAAIDSAVTGKGRVPVRDGELKGQVQAHGITMTIGRSTRRKGEAEVHSLEGKLSVADLVDPGIQDPESADAARIKALVGLLGPEADLKVFGDLPADAISAATREATDLVDMAARIKRDLEAAARHHEAAATNARREIDAGKTAMGDAEPDWARPEAEVNDALERAIETRADLQARRTAAIDTAKRAADSKAALEAATDGETEVLAVLDAHEAVGRAKTALAEAEAQLVTARTHDGLTTRWRADIDRAEEAAAVAVADAAVELADMAVVDARSVVEFARRGREAAVIAEQVAHHCDTRDRLDALATSLRDSGRAVDDVLSAIIKSAGIDLSVKVQDKRVRLVTQTDRGVTCFGELSHGERWRMALDIAAEALGAGGELTIPQEAWEGLDPANRAAIAEHVARLGIIAYTAEADDGPLRVEEAGKA